MNPESAQKTSIIFFFKMNQKKIKKEGNETSIEG